MVEIWRPIEGYENNYEVSNKGRVRNKRTNHVFKESLGTTGYPQVHLRKNNKPRTFLIHRLVAQAFLVNKDKQPQVNHIDEDKTNNDVSNLEWCSAKHNANHGTRIKRCNGIRINNTKNTKPVKAIHVSSGKLMWFPSANEAGRNGYDKSTIIDLCNGKRGIKTHKGFVWSWVS